VLVLTNKQIQFALGAVRKHVLTTDRGHNIFCRSVCTKHTTQDHGKTYTVCHLLLYHRRNDVRLNRLVGCHPHAQPIRSIERSKKEPRSGPPGLSRSYRHRPCLPGCGIRAAPRGGPLAREQSRHTCCCRIVGWGNDREQLRSSEARYQAPLDAAHAIDITHKQPLPARRTMMPVWGEAVGKDHPRMSTNIRTGLFAEVFLSSLIGQNLDESTPQQRVMKEKTHKDRLPRISKRDRQHVTWPSQEILASGRFTRKGTTRVLEDVSPGLLPVRVYLLHGLGYALHPHDGCDHVLQPVRVLAVDFLSDA